MKKRLKSLVSYSPYSPVLVATAVGLLLSVTSLVLLSRFQSSEIQRQFNQDAQMSILTLRRAFEANLFLLHSTAALLSSSQDIQQEEFEAIVNRFRTEFSDRLVVAWAAPVPVRQHRTEGYTSQETTGHSLIKYVDPPAGNESLAGFDLASQPEFLEVIIRSVNRGQEIAFYRSSQSFEPLSGFDFALCIPVYPEGDAAQLPARERERPSGLVLGLARVDAVLGTALVNGQPRGMSIWLRQDQADLANALLCTGTVDSRATLGSRGLDDIVAGARLPSHSERVDVAGQQWEIICIANEDYVRMRKTALPWLVSLAGILLTGLLAVYLHWGVTRRLTIERLVKERTAELEKANQALQREIHEKEKAYRDRHRLASAMEQVGEAMVMTDTEGTVQYVNPGFERITGYSSEEAIGNTPRILKSNQHDRTFYEELWNTIQRGETWTGRLINKRKDGRLYQEQAAISPVRDSTGTVVGYVKVGHDVTKVVELEEQLHHARQMEAIGQLAGGIAHDFNNLLQVIVGQTQLAMDPLLSEEQRREELEQIDAATQKASRLIRQLLAFSRRQNPQPRNLDLNRLVGELGVMLRRLIGEHIELAISHGARLGTIHADPGQVEQVILNLCVNARDAMPAGGRITVKTANVVLDRAYCRDHPWVQEGPYVLLSVTDTGEGIPPEVLKHVFEPFFTTKEVGKGTGLGLATVYGIVKDHGGYVDVESRLGKGSTFNVYFPVAEAEIEAESETVARSAAGGTETILLAEDEEMVRNLVSRILRRAGYTVLTAEDGEAAMNIYENQADSIQLVILDVVMPGLSGHAVLERIRAEAPQLPVLLSTGYDMGSLVSEVATDRVTQLIYKPFDPKELLFKVREMLELSVRGATHP